MKSIFVVMLASAALLLSSHVNAQSAEAIPTRYGKLTSSVDGLLTFKGRPVQAQVLYDGSASNYPVGHFKIGQSDVILFQQAQGRACPGNYAFVTVTAQGAKGTKNFGTCYDESTDPVQSGETVTFSMPNPGGRGTSTFTYKGGSVFKNGELIE